MSSNQLPFLVTVGAKDIHGAPGIGAFILLAPDLQTAWTRANTIAGEIWPPSTHIDAQAVSVTALAEPLAIEGSDGVTYVVTLTVQRYLPPAYQPPAP